jgi:hypothetical protein
MSRKTAEILMDDEEMDILESMLKAMGYDYLTTDITFGKNLIERENVEKNFKMLEKMVQGRSFRRSPCFAVGYIILTTGAHMPETLREDIMEAAKWEHEEGRWLDEEFALRRKICLKDFHDKVRLYQSGDKLFPISLSFPVAEIENTILNPKQLQESSESKEMFKIKHINLDGWGLKFIPKKIFECNNLKTLSLEHNQIIETSDKLGTLSSLEHLYLNDNEITILPDSVGNLEKLESLSITNNPLSRLPKTLTNIRRLRYVYIRGTHITKKPDFFKDARFDDYNDTIYLKEV